MSGGDPPGMATAVGSTHPTGMHSCLSYCFSRKFFLIGIDINFDIWLNLSVKFGF